MREPYGIMFAGYENHWLLAPYLAGDEPDWAGLANEPRLDSLSTGEKVLFDLAAALKNASVYLDADHQIRIMVALQSIAAGARP